MDSCCQHKPIVALSIRKCVLAVLLLVSCGLSLTAAATPIPSKLDIGRGAAQLGTLEWTTLHCYRVHGYSQHGLLSARFKIMVYYTIVSRSNLLWSIICLSTSDVLFGLVLDGATLFCLYYQYFHVTWEMPAGI